jgi:hypothetical protein
MEHDMRAALETARPVLVFETAVLSSTRKLRRQVLECAGPPALCVGASTTRAGGLLSGCVATGREKSGGGPPHSTTQAFLWSVIGCVDGSLFSVVGLRCSVGGLIPVDSNVRPVIYAARKLSGYLIARFF